MYIIKFEQMIDLSYYVKLSNNKISFLVRVMNIFIEDTPKDLEELKKVFAEKNFKKVKEVCHKLKGLFKSYNMQELAKVTIELENSAKAEILDSNSERLLSDILRHYATLRIEMIELRDSYN